MLAVILKILSVLGIILLVILGLILVALLLILFFPVFYRIQGKKNSQDYFVSAKVNWLFGLVRVKCVYPDPGNITAKVLFFKIFDSSAEKASAESDSNCTDVPKYETKAESKENIANAKESVCNSNAGSLRDDKPDSFETNNGESNDKSLNDNTDKSCEQHGDEENASEKNVFSGLSSKYKKLEYTLQKIYDKIKEIFENIDFYRKLLAEENTKALLKHAFTRLCRVLKNIRPRRLKANIIFGAATPDITGYIYGIYGMVSSSLGRNFYLEPDFTRQVLEGELFAAGHITVFTILFNTAMVVFDKKLKILKRKLKKHSLGKNKNENQKENLNKNNK